MPARAGRLARSGRRAAPAWPDGACLRPSRSRHRSPAPGLLGTARPSCLFQQSGRDVPPEGVARRSGRRGPPRGGHGPGAGVGLEQSGHRAARGGQVCGKPRLPGARDLAPARRGAGAQQSRQHVEAPGASGACGVSLPPGAGTGSGLCRGTQQPGIPAVRPGPPRRSGRRCPARHRTQPAPGGRLSEPGGSGNGPPPP